MAAPGASETVIVVTGGDPVDARHLPDLPHGAMVVAADSGIDRAHDLGLRVDLAVGDFASVTERALPLVRADRAVVERHPAAKDATDSALALDADIGRASGRERVSQSGSISLATR